MKKFAVVIFLFFSAEMSLFSQKINLIPLDTQGENFTWEEIRWQQDHPILRIGVWNNSPPYAFPDENGKLQGIWIDYLKEFDEKLILHLETVPVENFMTGREMILAGELDLLVGVTPSERNLEIFNLSQVYHTAPVVLVTREDYQTVLSLRDFRGESLVVNKGHVVEQWLKADYPEIDLLTVNSYEEGLRLVSEGKAEGYIGSMAIFIWEIRKMRITNLKIAYTTPYEYRLSVAARKDLEEFIPIINKVLTVVEMEQGENIYDKWITIKYEKEINWALILEIAGGITGIIIIVLLVSLIWIKKLKNEIIKKEEIKNSLLRSRQFLDDIGIIAKIGGWSVEVATSKVEWTDEVGKILEQPKGKFLSLQESFNVFHPEDRQLLEKSILEAIEHQIPYDFSARIVGEKGKIKWVHTRCKPVVENGKTVKLLGSLQDITEMKLIEEALAENKQKFAILFRNNPLPVVVSKLKDGTVLEINSAFSKVFGFQRTEIIGKQTSDIGIFVENDQRENLFNIIAQMKVVTGIETHLYVKSGEMIDVSFSTEVVDLNEEEVIISIFENITERKNIEKKLKLSEMNLRRAQKIGNIGHFSLDLINNNWDCSDQVYEIFNLSKKKDFDFNLFMNFIAPEDLNSVQDAWAKAMKGEEYNIKHRIHLNGDVKWVHGIVEVIFNDSGEPVEGLGTLQDITELKEAEQALNIANKKLEELASHDGLTGVYNRRIFDEKLAEEWIRLKRTKENLSMIIFDIDHFKKYNDTLGHQEGDKCLQRIAKTGNDIVVRAGDFFARYGGEEFVAVLPNTPSEGARIIAEKIRKAVWDLNIPKPHGGENEFVSVSCGVATEVPDDSRDEKSLIKQADEALYRAKNAGRNRVVVFFEE